MREWMQNIVFLGCLIILFTHCQNPYGDAPTAIEDADTLFRYIDSSESNINFINKVVDGEDFNVLSYRNFYNGGGVGLGDVNNDGLLDVYFTANMENNRLYLNKGGFVFEDITHQAGVEGQRGWSTGVSMVDVNADGYLDIYVSNSGDIAGDSRQNELFINNGNLTFTERAADYNLDNRGFTTHASFFDYDLDGDLDCYILNNSFKDPSRIDIYSRTREEDDALGGDKLMRNDGGTFTDVTKEAGIFSSAIGFGLGVSVGDVTNDHLPDIYISNDFWERDYLYINQGDGTFHEELADRLSICSVSSMGADIGDINNDGFQDIFSTDMLAADNYRLKAMTMFDPFHLEDLKFRSSYHYQILQNCLQVNVGEGAFRETAALSGVAATDWSWGALMFDFDNNGWKDIYVCNGIYHDIMYLDFANFIEDREEVKKVVTEKGRYDFRDFVEYLPSNPLSNYAFVNNKDLTFSNKADELGFKPGEFSNGAAYGDLDNDGDLDLVINNVNMAASVYRNTSEQTGHHYISFHLSDPQSKNLLAIGAKVTVYTGDQIMSQEHFMNRGFQSSVGHGLIFGLGTNTSIDSVKIVWPDQSIERITDLEVDTQVAVIKGAGASAKLKIKTPQLVFRDASDLIRGNATHKEDLFNDFDHERLLPRMLSTEGPKLATADVNADGYIDFITLGATGDADKLFLGTSSGTFNFHPVSSFQSDAEFESTCVAFVDADNDGDPDLIIGSGGNQLSKGMEGFLLRYYENDGKGNFLKVDYRTPPGGGQFSVIAPGDMDNDGDMDLFVGGRSIPGNYGLVPRSFLFENQNGTWTDITNRELGTVGMVTDAIWSDIDADNFADLIVVGEWMPVTLFKNQNGRLDEPIALDNSHGWWLDIEETDLDNDGQSEFILGNWGLNTKFRASLEQPIKMYVKDFDNNGKTEFVINWYPPGDNQAYPFATKMDMTDQLPHLKKKYLKYEDFARQDYTSLFSPEERKGAIEYTCYTLNSSILTFSDQGFSLKALPMEAQISPVFATAAVDINGDQLKDLWLGGNFYGLKPQLGRHDASRGVLLKNLGNGDFEEIIDTGGQVKGEVRDVQIINVVEKTLMIIARNNLPIKVLTL